MDKVRKGTIDPIRQQRRVSGWDPSANIACQKGGHSIRHRCTRIRCTAARDIKDINAPAKKGIR